MLIASIRETENREDAAGLSETIKGGFLVITEDDLRLGEKEISAYMESQGLTVTGEELAFVAERSQGNAYTVRADSKFVVRGKSMPAFTWRADGLVNGDTFTKSPSITADIQDTDILRKYDIVINGGTLQNSESYSTAELELICKDQIAEDGTASLAFTHASDYVIAVDGDAEEESGGTETAQQENADRTDGNGTAQGSDGILESPGAGQTDGAWRIIMTAVILLAAAVGAGVIAVARKKREEENRKQ